MYALARSTTLSSSCACFSASIFRSLTAPRVCMLAHFSFMDAMASDFFFLTAAFFSDIDFLADGVVDSLAIALASSLDTLTCSFRLAIKSIIVSPFAPMRRNTFFCSVRAFDVSLFATASGVACSDNDCMNWPAPRPSLSAISYTSPAFCTLPLTE